MSARSKLTKRNLMTAMKVQDEVVAATKKSWSFGQSKTLESLRGLYQSGIDAIEKNHEKLMAEYLEFRKQRRARGKK